MRIIKYIFTFWQNPWYVFFNFLAKKEKKIFPPWGKIWLHVCIYGNWRLFLVNTEIVTWLHCCIHYQLFQYIYHMQHQFGRKIKTSMCGEYYLVWPIRNQFIINLQFKHKKKNTIRYDRKQCCMSNIASNPSYHPFSIP